MNPWQLGYKACCDGEQPEDCPFLEDPAAQYDWLDGYEVAMHDEAADDEVPAIYIVSD